MQKIETICIYYLIVRIAWICNRSSASEEIPIIYEIHSFMLLLNSHCIQFVIGVVTDGVSELLFSTKSDSNSTIASKYTLVAYTQ
jgi:hypothetical protein